MEEFAPGTVAHIIRIQESQTRPAPAKAVLIYEGTITEDGKGIRLGGYSGGEIVAIAEGRVFKTEEEAMAAADKFEATLPPHP